MSPERINQIAHEIAMSYIQKIPHSHYVNITEEYMPKKDAEIYWKYYLRAKKELIELIKKNPEDLN